jgi:NAD(P)-dependent dehydrogenase (short-subunit alcohol dehydrogenase family)
MKNFTDKVVVITGAGSGIGRALALDFAGRGARLALSDINEAGLAETVEAVKGRGAEVRADRLDVADRAAFEAYAAAVLDHFGGVDVVINNAGVALAGDLVDLEWDDIDWIIGINFWGVVHGTKFFLPALLEAGHEAGEAHLVNISSLFGLVSMPGQSMYNAAKYAVRGMTEALREEMLIGRTGVGVTAVHPGGIKTAIARSARTSAKEDQAATAKLFDEKLAKTTPEKAAAVIIRGIEKRQARVLIGLDAHAVHNVGKFTGSRYQDLIALGAKYVLPPKAR